ncbi:MAG TPA: DUF1800 domain-containing protein [Azospira sp.]|nr:DUF1800 domain-containing protein [Azospira sp.]
MPNPVVRLFLCVAAGLLLACTGRAAPMGEADARHLLNRTGFGAPPQMVASYAKLSREQAVDRLLAGARSTPVLTPPSLVHEPLFRVRELGEEEKKAVQRAEFEKGVELRAWWLQEMLQTPSPLSERMTLFWHNHFVSSQQKVKSGKLMLDQNLLLRRHALGNFGELLHAVAKDPAMIIYLDAATNRKGQPNENFAREVMELFTLGEGHYGEQDVKEAARAFTGWSLERETGRFKWRPPMHDDGEKRVLGRSGNFDGDDVLDILLAQPAMAEFITGKLWREFVSPTPNAAEVKRVAERFRAAGLDIRPALRALLLTRSFWAPENRGALVKSPVDLVVGSLRTLEVSVPDALPLAFTMRNLGQDLLAPPNVRGWPGGEAWINSTTLLARKQFMERLLRNDEFVARAVRADGVEVAYEQGVQRNRQRVQQLREEFGKGPGRLEGETRMRMVQAMSDIRFDSRSWLAHFTDAAAVERALLPVAAVAMPPTTTQGIALVRAFALDPAYQLK